MNHVYLRQMKCSLRDPWDCGSNRRLLAWHRFWQSQIVCLRGCVVSIYTVLQDTRSKKINLIGVSLTSDFCQFNIWYNFHQYLCWMIDLVIINDIPTFYHSHFILNSRSQISTEIYRLFECLAKILPNSVCVCVCVCVCMRGCVMPCPFILWTKTLGPKKINLTFLFTQ